jgi:hypothetical protein
VEIGIWRSTRNQWSLSRISFKGERTPMKVRTHNEWFRTISLGNRKSCPTCGHKLDESESIWSWGEYVHGKWNTIKHFCKYCFVEQVRDSLEIHKDHCGCTIELVGQGVKLPFWLRMPDRQITNVIRTTEPKGQEL